VDVCANCGAPLDLDEAGACRWCHARIRRPRVAVPLFRIWDESSLVPEGTDGCRTSASFLSLALSTLTFLGLQPVVKEYTQREPRLLEQVRALSRAVSTAGVRVRDSGLLKDSFDSNLAIYTPEEIWTFDLAFDVIALISALDGLTGDARAQAASNMGLLDGYAGRPPWQQAMATAGDGPVAWRELRAQVPHRG
jgi:hypothetical protein